MSEFWEYTPSEFWEMVRLKNSKKIMEQKEQYRLCVINAYYNAVFDRTKKLKKLDQYLSSIDKIKDGLTLNEEVKTKNSDQLVKEARNKNKDMKISDEELKKRIEAMGLVAW